MKKFKTCALAIVLIFVTNIFTVGCSTDDVVGYAVVGGIGYYWLTSKSDKKSNSNQLPQPFYYEEYAEVDYGGLVNFLKQNAALANKKLKGQKIKIINGKIGLIDADGQSFMLDNPNYFGSDEVHCEIADKIAENQLLNTRRDQYVDIYGVVTRVGETLGYSIDVHRIELPGQRSMP